ncbi:hypothetical protein A3I50_05355 [Candidatus Roizmanbacteria bacterium RIFCSPLOWO2_02_FULL_37_9]|uniref:Uncharacterized protein n=1 Tax=Candidatus Roizmanbacteria bacterium RIFCSPLOWO2_01_FULL_37_16 TaxID=1802058 RepID=A0A1F7IPH9_9BACT|nr:MAG: hypothetical protein A2859_01625 [Candidatus Roizmanbacteria bacterium RIFCSPHIGHO2_01_FULL_37_16b]OGK34226.1 MAG: hypothetical protein A3F57_06305 [Candidatus Roizmanbacteria bacterium RIFCSPHIGHO2_12_FULL_36_11]OGK45284.1 MAG: hypothetical protein A3B40_05055 [Candidatus Roizmanbacteria bacterium RIFCSPLOWO2_01_FULL_37_16]OGK56947.1 MAG: hypothetical protein A3I50_05355 [Candidatus Roizmanbacteria bacterium RIFCSPLOWO2_02_FULL_37_9]
MKKKISKIPKFKSLEEEANFWDTHSFADYWGEFKDVKVIIDLKKPKDDTLIVRLQKGFRNQLERIARSKGLNVSTLARMWLMEKFQASK